MEETIQNIQQCFEDLLNPSQIVAGERLAARSPGYCPEAYGAGILVLPETKEQLSSICTLVNERNLGLVPHGGLTGLVEGTESQAGQIAVSLERLNRIIEIDPNQGIAVVEAGVVLQDFIDACGEHDLMPAIDIPSRGSCQIGGLISTNAGGVRVIKYGMTRDNILGLEVVLADGQIIDAMNRLVKNNAGFDLKHMFIGSEGTLGIITRAVVKLVPKPKSTAVALVACGGFEQAVALLAHARQHFDTYLMSFEVMWPDYYAFTTSQPGFGQRPLATGHPIYIIIETGSWNGDAAGDELENFLADQFEEELVKDATLAQSEAQRLAIWRAREDSDCIETLDEACLTYDVGMTLEEMPGYVQVLKEKMARLFPKHTPYIYGHMGDGNLHVQMAVSAEEFAHREQFDQIVYGGLDVPGQKTISAEHGIGLEKRAYLGLSRDPAYVSMMRLLKRTLDPNGILNPGKVLNMRSDAPRN